MRDLKGVEEVADPFAEGGTISRDGRLASVTVRYDLEPQELKKPDGEALVEAAETAERNGVSVAERGILIDLASEQTAPVGELIGVAIAILLLTLLFRSLAAMAVTLAGALIGVVVGQILLAALAAPLDLPAFATVIAVMLGLGAGIDYSLLIIARVREQMAAGDSVRDASAKAAATAGSSVVAAGLIVMVAIAGLLVIGIPLIGKLGIAAALGVAAVVVSALTILPIMIGAFAEAPQAEEAGARRALARLRALGRDRHGAPVALDRGRRARAARVRGTRDAAAPRPARRRQPADRAHPARRLRRAQQGLRPGLERPVPARRRHAEGRRRAPKQQLASLRDAVAGTKGVAAVAPATLSQDGEMATIIAVPTTAPQDARTSDLLERLREDVIPKATSDTPLKVYVGGQTPGFEDFSDKVASRLPLFIAVVIGLSVLLLIAAFRSLWIPLVSAIFNLLSVGAAYGVVVAVFQEGVGASLIGVDSGVPIVSFIPVMLFAILFGLSMDYNVFLLSRIHEAYNEGDGPRESVIHGMSRIGKVVLFAGLIMSAVFTSFVTQPDVIGKMFGVGLGLAILIDVLIVRMVIAPAVVTLLGDRAWWLPGWLDRLLPDVSLEGHLVEGLDEKTVEEERVAVHA